MPKYQQTKYEMDSKKKTFFERFQSLIKSEKAFTYISVLVGLLTFLSSLLDISGLADQLNVFFNDYFARILIVLISFIISFGFIARKED